MPLDQIDALLRRALRYATKGHRLLPVCVALSFAGTVSAAYPVTAVVVPATLLAAARWRSISVVSAFGSALGAAVLMVVFHHLGWSQLFERFPQLANNETWIRIVGWAATYGVIALFLIAVSPLPQTPALIFLGAVQHDFVSAFAAMLLGKLIKYGAFAWTASHFPERVGRGLDRILRRAERANGADEA
ncbi:MAG: hypothetical protein EYC67_16335 [Betaproteobacteria bacterium]|nr:MAG: hypothetical protein EYC67_16335 [Betaproteobacteria bacterium]